MKLPSCEKVFQFFRDLTTEQIILFIWNKLIKFDYLPPEREKRAVRLVWVAFTLYLVCAICTVKHWEVDSRNVEMDILGIHFGKMSIMLHAGGLRVPERSEFSKFMTFVPKCAMSSHLTCMFIYMGAVVGGNNIDLFLFSGSLLQLFNLSFIQFISNSQN